MTPTEYRDPTAALIAAEIANDLYDADIASYLPNITRPERLAEIVEDLSDLVKESRVAECDPIQWAEQQDARYGSRVWDAAASRVQDLAEEFAGLIADVIAENHATLRVLAEVSA